MKKLFLVTAVISSLFCYPAFGQDDITTIEYKEDFTQYTYDKNIDEEFAKLIAEYTDTYSMYSVGNNVNVRVEPNTECEIRGQLMIGTSVEAIASHDGWVCIGTEDGIAFVCADYLCMADEYIPQYTAEELDIMAHVLAGECQSLPDQEQLYVGSVVLNRVGHARYPDTIEGVVFQKGQYACVTDGNYYREPTDRNWENASWLLENGSILPPHVIYQSGGLQGDGLYLETEYHKYCY